MKSLYFAEATHRLWFHRQAPDWLGQPWLYLAAHREQPGLADDQDTHEISRHGYARLPIAREPAGFSIEGAALLNASRLAFADLPPGPVELATWISLGLAPAGATPWLWLFRLDEPLAFAPGPGPVLLPERLRLLES